MPRLWIFGQSGDVSPVKESKKQDKDDISDKKYQPLTITSPFSVEAECVKNKSCALSTSTLYYAVSLPGSRMEGKVKSPLVFMDKKSALEALMKNEGARFKVFHSHEEAVDFASHPVETICKTPKTEVSSPPVFDTEKNSGVVNEKASQFRGPKSQDVVKLRKIIASGDVTPFQDIVWSNPRYLITAVDTPTVFQEGFRYNALHIAAKSKQPELCEEIINTIQNPAFLKLLYSDDTEVIRLQRLSHILDLYLNMPDKGLCETPLHFAAKFGCLKTVKILASHPVCDTTIRNKYGLQAKEVICDRCPAACIQLKQQIEEALEEKYYVPVLRSEDNSVQPTVGKPFCKENSELPQHADCSSPYSSSLSVMAMAGPMLPELADAFYKSLKTPPANFSRAYYNELHKVRLCDTEKGLERIGRNLAHSFKTTWTEFWPSLNVWCDLTSPEGLMTLEEHLRKQHQEIRSKVMSISVVSNDLNENHLNGNYEFTHSTPSVYTESNSNNSSGMSSVCSLLERFHIQSPPSHPDTSSLSMCKPTVDHHLRLQQYLKVSESENILESLPNGAQNGVMEYLFDREQNGVESLSNLSTNAINNNTPWNMADYMEHGTDVKAKRMDGLVMNKCGISFPDPSNCRPGLDNCFVFSSSDVIGTKCIKELLMRDDANQFLFSVNNVILCILKVFSVLAINSDFISCKTVHEFVDDVLPEIKCLLKSSQDIDQDLSEIHNFIAEQIYKQMSAHFLKHEENVIFHIVSSYLCYFSVKRFWEDEEELCCSDDLPFQHLKCILHCFSSLSPDEVSKFQCSCNWTHCSTFPERLKMHGDCNFSFMKTNHTKENDRNSSPETEDSEDDFFTPPASLNSDSDDEPVTPDEGLEVYIEGEYPSKADLDIFRAVESLTVDPVKYPHICHWKHLIMSKDKKITESWRTPVAMRMKQLLESSTTSPVSLLSTDCNTPKSRKSLSFHGSKTVEKPRFSLFETSEIN